MTAVAGSTRPLLEVDDVRTWFWTNQGLLRAVDGVSFDLLAGRTLGIVGESGSGKSVLSLSLMDLLPSSAIRPTGQVFFDGQDLRELSVRERQGIWGKDIGLVLQDPMTSLNPVVRVGRHITEAIMRHLGLNRSAARAKAIEMLDHVGIPEAERRFRAYPHELSGGMRQRVSIAVALSCEPRLLIADEPTTALDVTIQRQILDLLGRLQAEEGMAMMMITHNLGVVAGRCDDTAVMYAGKILEVGPTNVLFSDMRHPYTAALLASIPRLEGQSHARLAVIPGRPASVIDPAPGCRFAPRCPHAQPKCLTTDPELTLGTTLGHRFACFYPVGTPEGADALARNHREGRTAAGLELQPA